MLNALKDDGLVRENVLKETIQKLEAEVLEQTKLIEYKLWPELERMRGKIVESAASEDRQPIGVGFYRS